MGPKLYCIILISLKCSVILGTTILNYHLEGTSIMTRPQTISRPPTDLRYHLDETLYSKVFANGNTFAYFAYSDLKKINSNTFAYLA